MIVIGFVHPDIVGWKFTASLLRCLMNPNLRPLIANIIDMRSGPNTGRARNMVVEGFMNTSAEWFLSVDADMTWEPDDVVKLLHVADAETRPIVGGLFFDNIGEQDVRPVLWGLNETKEYHHISSYPEGVVQVGVAPVAFGLFHRSVFEQLGNPWFCYDYNGKPTDDESTGFNYRLADAGIPVLIDTRVKIGHLRLRPVTEKDYPRKERLANKWWQQQKE